MPRTYVAVAIPSDANLYAVLIFGVNGRGTWAWTQGYGRYDCLHMARDLIATFKDMDYEDVNVALTFAETGCPCPWCGLADGFHDEKIHSRFMIARAKIKEKGWQYE